MDERDRALLERALESAHVALRHRDRFGPDWQGDVAAIDAIAKRLEDVGELVRRLSPGFTSGHPEVPWDAIAALRHRLVHGYAHLDLAKLAAALEQDVPELIGRLTALLARPEAGER